MVRNASKNDTLLRPASMRNRKDPTTRGVGGGGSSTLSIITIHCINRTQKEEIVRRRGSLVVQRKPVVHDCRAFAEEEACRYRVAECFE